nr:MAG TPA: hypothetical protein [Crassvirales sp.]
MVVNVLNVNKKYLQAVICMLYSKLNKCKAYRYNSNRKPKIQNFI